MQDAPDIQEGVGREVDRGHHNHHQIGQGIEADVQRGLGRSKDVLSHRRKLARHMLTDCRMVEVPAERLELFG